MYVPIGTWLFFTFLKVSFTLALQHISSRIVNGTVTTIEEFPYQVSLQTGDYHGCGAAIISENFVLTAAHCFKNQPKPENIKIRVGSKSWVAGGKLLQAAAYKAHSEYSSESHLNDIAVVKLNETLKFSKTINKINLANSTLVNGTKVVVAGWGFSRRNETFYHPLLKKIELTILSRETCAPYYNYGTNVQKTMICAFDEGRDTCRGDSGGPLSANGTLVGIVSWGIGCAIGRYPGVYTDVASFNAWIQDECKKLSLK